MTADVLTVRSGRIAATIGLVRDIEILYKNKPPTPRLNPFALLTNRSFIHNQVIVDITKHRPSFYRLITIFDVPLAIQITGISAARFW